MLRTALRTSAHLKSQYRLTSILYTRDHYWVQKETKNATHFKVGLSDYAQDSYGDFVMVEIDRLNEEKIHVKEKPLNNIKKLFKRENSELLSAKAVTREEEERKRILDDNSLLTRTGGVDPSLWTRQEPVLSNDLTSLFHRKRSSMQSTVSSRPSSLSTKLSNLISIAHIPEAERRVEEQKIVFWVPDSDVPICMNCGLSFGIQSALLLSRRHHCRTCGALVCTDCCQQLRYDALAEAISAELNSELVDPNAAVRVCEFCFLEIAKIGTKTSHKESESIIFKVYARWAKVKSEIGRLTSELQYHTREPIYFKELVSKLETEMRKLERLSQQIGNIIDADDRLVRGLQRVTSLILHDTKLEMISRRAQLDLSSKTNSSVASSKSSPRNSPFSSVPSTPAHSSSPIRTASPEPAANRINVVNVNSHKSSGTDPFRIPSRKSEDPPANPFEDENDNYDNELNPFANDSSSNVSEKSDKIQMSPRIENIFEVEKDEKDVQIEFLLKDIERARKKGDLEKVAIIQQVLDQFLQEQDDR
ncbi:Oidioi.mRNA.OKI2018_I69.XSR.g15620.t1.cds [Oikopleura dioica]|uniref:Oidioi.mRNA.OKI2018_I69.XSR.g15620.t1.cds n=1 Tax=Oikopleura dioica TaxID=34765 RepID=A0ABN7SDY9_OIKDI|nr:Oidioi.mRNA.OKI2018_I69.XSR.g15620.t1.cds [Oikopleura dioica]